MEAVCVVYVGHQCGGFLGADSVWRTYVNSVCHDMEDVIGTVWRPLYTGAVCEA